MLLQPPPPALFRARATRGRATRRALQPRAALPEAAVAAADAPWAIGGALGAAALAFAGTFFVSPLYKDSFKEPQTWEDIHGILTAQGVKSLPPAEAQKRTTAMALPWAPKPVILDVRLPGASLSIPGALRLSPYKLIDSNTVFSLIRKAAFAFFAVPGTERDPEWLERVRAAVPDLGREVIVACERGGSLETRPGTQYGFSSRSLKALHFLRQAGYRNVTHLQGGVYEWSRTPGLEMIEDASS